MDQTTLATIISSAATIIVAILASWFTAQRALAQIEVKVDLLWKTYIVDAIKDSRTSGLVASKSPEAPTEAWIERVPQELREEIEATIHKLATYLKSPYDITVATVGNIGLERIACETSLKPTEVIGTIFVITERILDGHYC